MKLTDQKGRRQALAEPQARAPGARRWRLLDCAQVRRLRVPAVSPEGTRGALIVDAARDREDDRFAALWIVPADGQAAPHRLTHGADGEKSAQWSPDTRRVALVFDLERGGEPRPLADRAEGVESCAWSPGGKVLAVAARDPSAQQAAYLASIRQPRQPGP